MCDTGVQAEVHGIGHRHAVTVPISLGLATRLVEAGAPRTVGSGVRSKAPVQS
jgi:hypothetical protein